MAHSTTFRCSIRRSWFFSSAVAQRWAGSIGAIGGSSLDLPLQQRCSVSLFLAELSFRGNAVAIFWLTATPPTVSTRSGWKLVARSASLHILHRMSLRKRADLSVADTAADRARSHCRSRCTRPAQQQPAPFVEPPALFRCQAGVFAQLPRDPLELRPPASRGKRPASSCAGAAFFCTALFATAASPTALVAQPGLQGRLPRGDLEVTNGSLDRSHPKAPVALVLLSRSCATQKFP